MILAILRQRACVERTSSITDVTVGGAGCAADRGMPALHIAPAMPIPGIGCWEASSLSRKDDTGNCCVVPTIFVCVCVRCHSGGVGDYVTMVLAQITVEALCDFCVLRNRLAIRSLLLAMVSG